MSDDIENTINNFLIEAAAMRAALERQAEQVVQVTGALQQATTENLRARKQLAHMVSAGVYTEAASRIAQSCAPLVKSISQAANQAEHALGVKLEEVERAQVAGWLIQMVIALGSGFIASMLTAFAIFAWRLWQ
ncbi:hypothetical protein [Devosia chinhatensis]|uniref:Uncharacterized protein n=1 Tax=Devosia chinhatensis TaxID=429727 RepID=A0A0F5FLX0_9HYPH|nr:hypothetical protein [Devosia chinhatensis]KKB09197.1 hypothetical protein VE26_04175 [Devosia chinhatensis]